MTGVHIKDDSIDTTHGCILYIEGVTVSFDGFKALNDLNLYIDDGELRCIIGPNGAGKTTMMDVITGKTRPDKGAVFFGQNHDLTKMNEYEISHAGIGRKFQKPTVFQNHTVFENLELALHTRKDVWQTLTRSLTRVQIDTIEKDLETIGLKDQKNLRAGLLSHGQKQWLEIGMLLAQKPNLLLIDEPAAGMTYPERKKTVNLLKKLSKNQSIIVVEHDMEFIKSLECRVTVLHEGTVIAEGSLDYVSQNKKVIDVYLGR